MTEETKKRPLAVRTVWALLFLIIVAAVFVVMLYFGARITGNTFNAPASFYYSPAKSASTAVGKRQIVILDAGHGGIDSGASGVAGTREKDLNLSYAFAVADNLRLLGFDVLFTRDGDYMLDTDGSKSRKLSDVTQRVKFSAEHPDALFVSIHMNTNPVKSCQGTQVYYSVNNTLSKSLALSVQGTVKELIQPDNKREAKAAGSNIFILDRIESPAILVECGFISNYQEEILLNDAEYRREMAFAVATAIYKYQSY
ncbi:MAG: N-acetylmuramoyl-L-alanine amidase [Firmicutes bacterium]|nr:N-acetylmuramoyl-L-alanine amidase [Bacillota bacterium]